MKTNNRFTNKHGLPPELCAAISRDRYSKEDEAAYDYSATQIISPIQATILKKRYPDNTPVRDITDDTWSFFGSVCHAQIEECAKDFGGLTETRLYASVNGCTVSGKMDRYVDGIIRDWKFTKVYKFTKGDFSDWEAQLNVLTYLLNENGCSVSRLEIVAFLRDWVKGNLKRVANYPKCEWQIIPIKLWRRVDQIAYISNRIRALQAAAKMTDEEIATAYPCSDKERWIDTIDYACMKEGATKATRKFDTEQEALDYIKDKPDLKIVERKTPPKRCLDFCDASPSCVQFKQWKEQNGMIDDSDEEPIF